MTQTISAATTPPWAEWFAKWEGWPKVRWLPTQKRKRNGEYEHVPMSYSCRLGRRRQGDYLAARRRRIRQAWFDRWLARLDEECATGDTTKRERVQP